MTFDSDGSAWRTATYEEPWNFESSCLPGSRFSWVSMHACWSALWPRGTCQPTSSSSFGKVLTMSYSVFHRRLYYSLSTKSYVWGIISEKRHFEDHSKASPKWLLLWEYEYQPGKGSFAIKMYNVLIG